MVNYIAIVETVKKKHKEVGYKLKGRSSMKYKKEEIDLSHMTYKDEVNLKLYSAFETYFKNAREITREDFINIKNIDYLDVIKRIDILYKLKVLIAVEELEEELDSLKAKLKYTQMLLKEKEKEYKLKGRS